jgi:hypothetical protein
VCKGGTTSAECGSGGASCAKCQAFESCSTGACHVNPSSNWKVKVVGATISQAKQWDGTGDLPDAYFGIDWGGCSVWTLDACSSWQKDTYTPTWNQEMATTSASTLMSPWCAFVIDGDSLTACMLPFQTIGQCNVTVTEADLKAGSKTLSACTCPDDNINYVSNLTLQFTYAP